MDETSHPPRIEPDDASVPAEDGGSAPTAGAVTRPDPAMGGSRTAPVWTFRASAVAVTLVSLATLVTMAPHLLLVANTPTGGDMGAHVLGPAYLRDVLLPSGRVMGWSNYWFAGFPIFYFYFPLPSLIIVGLDVLLPYGVAFKLVTVVGLVSLAPASYFLARSMGFARPVAAIAAAAGGAYAFMETPQPNIFGGTMASSLAGEFSYSWSFAFSLVYLGCLVRAVYGDRRFFPWAGAALALTALCHVIPTIGVVVASLFVVAGKAWRPDRFIPDPEAAGTGTARQGFKRSLWWIVAGSWALGFALAAFWALPLVTRLGYTTDMNWQPLAGLDELLPLELWPIAVLGVVGMAAALVRTGRALPLVALTVLPIPAFFLLSQGAKLWNGRALPHWFFGLHFFAGIAAGLLVARTVRRLPARISHTWVQSAVSFLVTVLVLGPNIGGGPRDYEAATGLAGWAGWRRLSIESLINRISEPDLLILAAGLLLVVMAAIRVDFPTGKVLTFGVVGLFIGAVFVGSVTAGNSGTVEHYASGWARWNYQGYEGKKTWSEYEGLMATVADLPPGRVQWEANRDLNEYGTPMAPMLYPYWTEGTHPSMEGLYFESSVTTPFHFLNAAELSDSPSNPIPGLRYHTGNFERGARHMELFNVAYYVAYTEAAKEKASNHPAFTSRVATEPFVIYTLPESSLVDVAMFRPWVFEEPPARLVAPLAGIFKEDTETDFVDVALDWYDDIEMLDQWVVADGPVEWERVGADLEGTRTPAVGGGRVSDVVLEDHRIAFRTTAVGVPHMVKVSYFPNWTATGALGPWRAAPAFMVVVPTAEQVELRFEDTWVENAGWWLTLGGLVFLAAWWAVARSRGGRKSEPNGSRFPWLRDLSLRVRRGLYGSEQLLRPDEPA